DRLKRLQRRRVIKNQANGRMKLGLEVLHPGLRFGVDPALACCLIFNTVEAVPHAASDRSFFSRTYGRGRRAVALHDGVDLLDIAHGREPSRLKNIPSALWRGPAPTLNRKVWKTANLFPAPH